MRVNILTATSIVRKLSRGAVVDIIEQAEKAGWTAVEAARAINDVSRGLFVGIQGKDPNE
ncbi:hypothetical protein [Brucella intermedia]|uniref:hypothetical protein n=1 Tax=Brucella intermedia TaxID=94625 RepID=UPI0003492F6E|nr:hypothetical protein [Brucella intermedia]